MDETPPTDSSPDLGIAVKRLLQRFFIIGENRLHLLLVEAEEERKRFLCAVAMGAIAAGFALLTGISFTLLIVLIFWDNHPAIALLVLTVVYAGVAAACYAKMDNVLKDWQTLPATIDQLKKDRECLEKQLG
jgi:uncharacterized membrane protein YqjE